MLWYVIKNSFFVKMGSLYQNAYSTILLLWYHTGLNPDRFLPMWYPRSYYFLIPVRFLELCNNQGICLEFYLIYIYLQTIALSTFDCVKIVGVRLSYFKSNFDDVFCMTCNLDNVSKNFNAILNSRIHKCKITLPRYLSRHKFVNMIKDHKVLNQRCTSPVAMLTPVQFFFKKHS